MQRLKFVVFCVMPTLLLLVLPETEQIIVGPVEVRLVGGDSPREGRLEVRNANGTWGTVCDDLWGVTESSVVCRQLGFGTFGRMAQAGTFVPGTGVIWLDDVDCVGNETSLGQCSSRTWGTHNCGHSEDVGVICREPEMLEARLVDGISETEGRLEVRKANGTWGTVCDDLWNTQASIVICNQLSFGGFGESVPPGSYPPGTGQIWLDNVVCTGRETNLGQCSALPWGQHNCAHGEDVGVVCHRSSVRLQPQNQPSRGVPYGSVEVLSGLRWLPICDINWNDDGARVACRSMGYEDGVPLCCSELASPIFYTSSVNIICNGTELSLDDCQLSFNRGCSALASAICYNERKDRVNMTFSVRLVNDSSHWGRVEVRHRGAWGFVCESPSWTDAAASVVCKELGFHGGGVRFGGSPTAQLSGSAWITVLNCTGNETRLEQCVVEPWGQATRCSTPASVLCYSTAAPVVRLAGGGTSFGRVEIVMDGETYTVCDNNWSDTDVKVVCQQLGFQSGQPVPQSYYGAGSGRVALDRLSCSTTDTSLLACRSGGWLQTDPSCSDHSKDASVVCFGAVQLRRGDHNTGILMISNGRTVYSVCSLRFSDAEATVACRELGFEHGLRLLPGSFGYLSANRRLAIRCSGNETRISSCHSTLNNCMGNTKYASVHCYNGSLSTASSLSLQGGQGVFRNSSGRLLVTLSGVQGKVCPPQWDDLDALVACRQLGYRNGLALAFPNSGFGFYQLSVVGCTGNETSIFNCQRGETCPFSSFSLPDPGVMCFNNTAPAVQLVGGASEKEGLVQVVYGGQVGTVCVPNIPNVNSARAVCRQLGFVDGSYKRFTADTDPVLLSDVSCTGDERSIFMCRNGGFLTPPSANCADHRFDLGVACVNDERLVNRVQETNDSVVGIVQIYFGSQWNNLCGDFFDDRDAQVVCWSLGYGYARALPPGVLGYQYFYGSVGFIPGLNCTGNEKSLSECPVHQTDSCGYQTRNNYAVALCSKTPVVPGLQAVQGLLGPRNVLVTADGVQSFVCPDNWDDATATAYCHDLGYTYGTAILESGYVVSVDTGIYLVSNVSCTGSESTLSQCSYSSSGWGSCHSGYSTGARVICHNNRQAIQVELTGGRSRKDGQVQVTFNGVRGPVCDPNFTNQDATVVCRSLGFPGGVATATTPSNSAGPFYLYYVRCTGSETNLWQCPSTYFNLSSSSYCSNSNTVPGVRCTGQVRLDGNEGYGAVQFTANVTSGNYGLVCDDSFSDLEASVVCRDVGYSYGIHLCCSAFGYKSTPIAWTQVRCTGTEAIFTDCSYSTSLSYCPSRNYASAVCSNTPPNAGYSVTIDTSISPFSAYGRIKVQHMGIWGYLCSNGFDNKDANVLCREAGYSGGFAVRGTSYSGDYRSAVRWLSNIDCDGTESHLSRCRNVVWGNVSDCQSYTAPAAAFCYRNVAPEFRLVNRTAGNAGRLEVWWGEDSSGAICGSYWTDLHADLACRGMGFMSGRFLGAGAFGQSGKPLLLVSSDCSSAKSPQSLFDCDLWLSGLSYSYCPGSGVDPGVQCFGGPVRLMSSRTENYGRVEVNVNNAWTAVCDQGFDQAAAQVACRALGFLYARPQCCSAVGPLGKGPIDTRQIGFRINRCRGDEAKFTDCDSSTTATCSSGKYASVLCSNTSLQEQELAVRLAGPAEFYGKVEVNRYGVWGPVCNNSWSDREANATCHGFGYSYGISFHGSDLTDNPFIVGGFQCTGLESSLANCTSKSSEEDIGCSETRVAAGVLCSRQTETKLRVTGGGRHYGRLEVQYEGQWGRVTSRYYFSSAIADVACRQLGFVSGQATRDVSNVATEQVWLSSVDCKGYEKTLFECPSKWRYSDGSSDARVICSNTTRLYSGNSLFMGTVEIYISKRWGSVCDRGWTSRDTMVACRDLGYDNGYRLCCEPFGTGHRPIGDNFQCRGAEPALNNCNHTSPEGFYFCPHEAVAVACYNEPAPSDHTFTLYGWPTESSGEMQVTFMNTTGRICSDGWDDTDARVFCRELGFPTGQAFRHPPNWYSSYYTPYWVTDVRCSGTESSLKDCPKTVGTVSGCSSKLSAGVTCLHVEGIQYNLTGSGSPSEGRLEVKVNGTWGTVCRNSFGSNNAKVACRMFGYAEGKIDYFRTYPNPPSIIYQSPFQCTGSEATLDDCPHGGWKTQAASYSYCTHSNDVTVICFDDVRVTGLYDQKTSQGPVLFYSNGTWYRLCDTDFDDVTARRVCQDMSYADGKAVSGSAYGTASYYVRQYEMNMNYTMQCRGTESDTTECLRQGGCLSTNYASVVCLNTTHVADESYSFGFDDNTKKSGQVAVAHLGVVGRICNTFWDDAGARVLCRSGGYADGIAYHYSQTNNIYQTLDKRGPFWLSGVNCTGSEPSLGDCPFNDRLNLGDCSTADAAGALCFNDSGIQYRIVDAGHPGAGRVEISVGDVWGTVCDQYWDDEDASVFCRTLNYTGGYAVPDAFYGEGAGPVWLSNLMCKGTETSLDKCPHSGFNDEVVEDGNYNYGCRSHSNDASVVCTGKIKLSLGFNASMGAVMVYLGNTWTLICDDGFDANSAASACRSVGFSHGAPVSGSVFGRTNASIGISNMRCTGREQSLLTCTYDVTSSCSSRSYASVVCSQDPIVDSYVKVRITRDTADDPRHGFVEVQVGGVWGAVCAAGFGNYEATVVCKELGFVGGVAYAAHRSYTSNYSGNKIYIKPILMSDVRCRDDEETLARCPHTRTSATSWCDYYAPRAGVLCYNDTNGISYRLIADTADPRRGRVEMLYEGQWGLICVQSSGSRAGGPACRNLGHQDGLLTSPFRYEMTYTEGFWFYQLYCQGNETSVPECASTGFNDSSMYMYRYQYTCRNLNTLHVECYSKDVAITDIRLVGGDSNRSGRVEVFLQGPDQWGTVCGNSWDDVDATIVCNHFRFATGKAVPNALFGEGEGRIWLDSVGCQGSERRLQDCAFTGFGENFCRHSQDAGVICSGGYVPPEDLSTTTTTTESHSQPWPVTSVGNTSTPSSQMLTADTASPNTAAIVVPILVVAAAIVVVAVFWYRGRHRKNPELLVTDGEKRPSTLACARVRFVNHVRDKMARKSGIEDANGSTNYSHDFASFDPGMSNPVYEITVGAYSRPGEEDL